MRGSITIAALIFTMAISVLGDTPKSADRPATPPATKPTSIFDLGLEPLPNLEEDKAPKTDTGKPVQPPASDSAKPVLAKAPNPADAPQPSKQVAPGPTAGFTGELADVLKASHVDANGVLTADQPITLGLKGTDGKHFILTGEFYLAPEPTQFNGGGVAFRLRRVDFKKSIDLNINLMRVKRILLEGKVVTKFAEPMKFSPLEREKWIPFKIDAGGHAIAVQFGDQKGIAKGPVATAGTNAITLRPGAKLRGLKLQILAD